MDKMELRTMMRKRLVDMKFDEDVLIPIEINTEQVEQDNEEYPTAKNLAEEACSTYEIRETELNIIKETSEPVEEEEEK